MLATETKRAMQNELLKYDCEIGFKEHDRRILRLTFKVICLGYLSYPKFQAASSKLEIVEKWFHAIMCNSVFDTKDVVGAVHSLVDSGHEKRQDGTSFCNALLNSINLKQGNF